jgi:hypothetical protein
MRTNGRLAPTGPSNPPLLLTAHFGMRALRAVCSERCSRAPGVRRHSTHCTDFHNCAQ